MMSHLPNVIPEIPRHRSDNINEVFSITSSSIESAMEEEISISEKQIDTNASFYVTFSDGTSFRNLVEYLRLINIEGVFRFRKDEIICEQANRDQNFLNIVKIKTYELTEYNFDSKSDEIVVGINLVELRNVTRSVGKKDRIEIYRLSGEPNNLYVRPGSHSEKEDESDLCIIPITSNQYTTYDIEEYSRGKRDPTCTIYQSSFSKLCKFLVTNKYNRAAVHGLRNGVIFKGITHSNTLGHVRTFGKCSTQDKPISSMKSIKPSNRGIIKPKAPPPILNIGEFGEVESFSLDIDIIKKLSKLNGLSPNGTIKIYIEKGLPLKLVCHVGTFAKLYTLINPEK